MEVNATAVFDAMPLASHDDGETLCIDPVATLGPDVLPLRLLGDKRFERLAHWWAEVVDGNSDARIHGPSGVRDFGIDVLARRPDGRYWAYQCKCVKEFKRADLTEAVDEFFRYSVADVDRFTVFVACEGSDVGLEPELRRLQQQHSQVELRVLYQGNLSNELRSHPSKVVSLFGLEWARAFCGTWIPGIGREGVVPLVSGLVPPLADGFQVRREAEQLTRASGTTSVLSGSGGVGKTQVAAYVAHKLWEKSELDLRLWITASSQAAILDGYAQASVRVGQSGDQGVAADARSFLEWLAGACERRWLIVLDDLADPADLRGWWPPHSSQGRVIVTTRRRDSALSAAGRQRMELSLFTDLEASAYVETKLQDHPRLADDVSGIVGDLGCMPLALAQATAFMIDEGLPCTEYRRRFANLSSALDKLVPEPDLLPDEYEYTLGKTWALSVEAANQREPEGMAGRLLTLAALLDPAGIPMDCLASAAARTWLKEGRGRATPEQVDQAAQCLQRFSLAVHDQSGAIRMLRIHALVQRATRDQTSAQSMNRVAVAAADGLYEIWPENETDRAFSQLLRDNATALETACPDPLWTKEGPHPLLAWAGKSLGEASHFQAAADHLRALRETAENRLGLHHPAVLDIRDLHATAEAHAGKYQLALAEFETLVKDHERIFGPDHRETLNARSRHAWRSGDVETAEATLVLFEGLQADCLRVLGPDDLLTLDTRQEVARWRGIAGDPERACRESHAILNDCIRLYGPDHEATLGARHNLAAFKGEAGELEGALADFEDLLTDMIPRVGLYDSNTIDIRWEIAQLRGKLHGPADAVKLFQELLADFTHTPSATTTNTPTWPEMT